MLALDPLARRGAAALRKRGDEAHLYTSLGLAERESNLRAAYAAGTLPVVRDKVNERTCSSLMAGPQLLQSCLRLDSILNHELEQRDSTEGASHTPYDHTPRSRLSVSQPVTPLRMGSNAALLDSPHGADNSSFSVASESAATHTTNAVPATCSVASSVPMRAVRSLHRRLNSDQLDDADGEGGSRIISRARSRAALLRESVPPNSFELSVISSPEPIST